jgi:hypothetical protein
MTQFNSSNSTSGAEHSAFQSAQSALARKPLPGPRWAWPGVAALAVAAVAYLVAGTSGEHAGQHPTPPAAEGAPPEAPNPVTTTVAALEPTAAAPAPTTPPASPAPAPVNDLAAAPPKAEAEAAKASEDAAPAVASASASTKKKARGAAHRAKRKRSDQAH